MIDELMTAVAEGSLAELSASTYEHLSTCSHCRAGLLVLARGFDSAPDPMETSGTCESCQVDLAAFIDLEADDPVRAAAAYPHVWWHLWICSACSQTYELTHALLGAQRSGAVQPLQLRSTRRAVPVSQHITLTRQALTLALPVRQPVFSVGRGPSDDSYVLYDDREDEPDRGQFTIVVQEQKNGFWEMIVSVIPPPTGLLVLTSGTLRFVAPFNPDGKAAISSIPSDVLTDSDAPNLEVNIVPAEGDTTSL